MVCDYSVNSPYSSIVTLGSLRSNNDSDNYKNGRKAIGLDEQNNNFSCASCFFVHFFAVTAQLRRVNA